MRGAARLKARKQRKSRDCAIQRIAPLQFGDAIGGRIRANALQPSFVPCRSPPPGARLASLRLASPRGRFLPGSLLPPLEPRTAIRRAPEAASVTAVRQPAAPSAASPLPA